ncbi:MAG: S-methyl-5'-thioadenosine phosphorylase [Deltaproteobacteria bacterium]|nr:S-methyl-5'-thioadenosine phosphorylase [Myxococcales bacterium]MDP3218148.1 S-methyl-5'-thioadenosine phosphorylase [Deltaproteobacteria bacterium]
MSASTLGVAVLGVIGGSGLYQMPGLTAMEPLTASTPFGEASDGIVRGRLGETPVVFLPRHGRAHSHSPSTLNYRANIYALKSLGVTHVLSVSAVGSLREEIAPGDLVVPHQFINRTTRRVDTFFDRDVVAHVSMADPVCPFMAAAVASAARATGANTHVGQTYVCIEGPRFSTRAESRMFRQWGADIIGMTNVPEAFLAREAELPYATLALATDYDSWREQDEAHVDEIIAVMAKNVARAQAVVAGLAAALPDVSASPAQGATKHAVMTRWEAVSAEARARYALLLGDRA